MHLQQLTLKAFGSLPDQHIDLDRGMNILVDTTRSWQGRLSTIVSGALFGLSDDVRARLLTASDEASVELKCTDGSSQYHIHVVFSIEGEEVRVEATSLPRSGSAKDGRRRADPAYSEQAATSDILTATEPDLDSGLSEISWIVTDLQSGLEGAIQRLGAERQETSGLLDAINLKSLRERASRARRIALEMEGLEKELCSDPAMDRPLSEDLAAAKSLDSHIDSVTKVIAMKETKLQSLREQLSEGRDKLEFYEYLKGIGVNDVSSVKRSLERKRWLMDDLKKLETEIQLGDKRLDAVASMVMKYDRLRPFLGSREMELDHLENQLEQLESRMPTLKLQQLEAEKRALRLQVQYWRRRRFFAALLSAVPLPVAILWPPAALLSAIGLGFMYRYWREVYALVQRLAVVMDRHDYLVLERNEIAAQIRSVEADIDSIRVQTGTASAAELHDKIDDYQRLLSELDDLKRTAAQREKARDELRRKLREEEQRAGALFDRVGLSAELDPATVDKFVEMVNGRINDERALDGLEKRIEDEQLEMEGLVRQVKVLQKRLSRLLATRRVKSITELQELWDAVESQDARHLYKQKEGELEQLLNGQRLADLEARVDMLSRLVPDECRIAELPPGVTPDRLEARFESIRVRSDLLKWFKGSVLPAVVEGPGADDDVDDLDRRQACVDLCLMCRMRQLLILVPDESWEAAIRSVASDLGVPASTVMLDGGDRGVSATDVQQKGDSV